MIFPIIFFWNLFEVIEACGVNQTNSEGVLEVQANCENFLEVASGKSINLKLPCESQAKSLYSIWMLVPESPTPIFHSNKSIDCSREEERSQTFQAPANVGLKIVSALAAKIQVQLLEDQKNLCGYPYIPLTSANLNQSRVIQNDTIFSSLQECVYRLDPGKDMDSKINQIKLRFSDITNLKYEQRIYRKNGRIEYAMLQAGENFNLEPFDIKINEYVRIPQINVTLGKNACHKIDRISTANKTLTLQPTLAQSDCENAFSILNIEFLQPKKDEIIYLEHNLNQENLKIWNLETDDIIMDTTHFLKNAALNFSSLKIRIENGQTWQVNLTRLEIPENCRCPTFGTLISSENSRLSLKSRNCVNLFCHVRLENSRKLTMNVDLKASDNGKNQGLIEPDFFGIVEKGKYFRETFTDESFSDSSDFMELSYIRFNNSKSQNTPLDLDMSWHFSKNCECDLTAFYLTPKIEHILTSTNYPNPYCVSRDCKTIIKTEPNAKLKFTIKKFHVDSEGDSLEIYDGPHIDSSLLKAKLQGRSREEEVIYTGSKAVLLFQSNEITTKDDIGYEISFRAELLNPSDLTTSTQVITTSQISTTEVKTSTEILVAPEEPSNSQPIPSSLIFFVILLIILGSGILSYFYKAQIIAQINNFRTKNAPPSGFENMNTQIF